MNDIVEVFSRGTEIPLPDPRLPSDAVLTDMVGLRNLPVEERSEALEPYLERWRIRKMDAIDVARYLSAAGLSLDEACALDTLVATRVREQWLHQARADMTRGLALIAAGALIFALGTVADPRFPVWGIVLIVLCVAGFRSLARGLRKQRRITPIDID